MPVLLDAQGVCLAKQTDTVRTDARLATAYAALNQELHLAAAAGAGSLSVISSSDPLSSLLTAGPMSMPSSYPSAQLDMFSGHDQHL
jgi:hypothetical protein